MSNVTYTVETNQLHGINELWRHEGDSDPRPKFLADEYGAEPEVFRAAAAVLAPDDVTVDVVARALFVDKAPGRGGAWDAPVEGGRESWRAQARAVLAALKQHARADS